MVFRPLRFLTMKYYKSHFCSEICSSLAQFWARVVMNNPSIINGKTDKISDMPDKLVYPCLI